MLLSIANCLLNSPPRRSDPYFACQYHNGLCLGGTPVSFGQLLLDTDIPFELSEFAGKVLKELCEQNYKGKLDK